MVSCKIIEHCYVPIHLMKQELVVSLEDRNAPHNCLVDDWILCMPVLSQRIKELLITTAPLLRVDLSLRR